MPTSRLASLLVLAAGMAIASTPAQPQAGFTRGSHTTRRRTNPVTRLPRNPDPEVARWNDAVDRREAERKSARGR